MAFGELLFFFDLLPVKIFVGLRAVGWGVVKVADKSSFTAKKWPTRSAPSIARSTVNWNLSSGAVL